MSAASAAETRRDEEPLRYPAFRRFWFSRIASGSAYQMVAVAVGWQIYALTRSPLHLGLIGLALFLPMVALVLPAGHFADRYDRRVVASIAQSLEAAAVLLLCAATAFGHASPPLVYAAVIVAGAGRATEQPSLSSLVPALVPSPLIPHAVARSTSGMQVAVIAGPALGGVLYAIGAPVVYGVAAGAFAAAAVFSGSIRLAAPLAPRPAPAVNELLAGVAFIRRTPLILGSISLDLFAVLLGGATALLPIYARDIFHTGPWGLGLLRSAPAAGALAMSIALGRRPPTRAVGRRMFAAVAAFGLATIVFAFSRSLWLALPALAALGAADVVSVVIRSSLVQVRTPDALRGRVNAVNSLFFGSSNSLGEFESGVTAAWFGTVPATVIGGIGTLVVAALWSRLFPTLLHAETIEEVPAEGRDSDAGGRASTSSAERARPSTSSG